MHKQCRIGAGYRIGNTASYAMMPATSMGLKVFIYPGMVYGLSLYANNMKRADRAEGLLVSPAGFFEITDYWL